MIAAVAACNTNMAVLLVCVDGSYDAPGLHLVYIVSFSFVQWKTSIVDKLWKKKLEENFQKKISGRTMSEKISGRTMSDNLFGEDNVQKIGRGG